MSYLESAEFTCIMESCFTHVPSNLAQHLKNKASNVTKSQQNKGGLKRDFFPWDLWAYQCCLENLHPCAPFTSAAFLCCVICWKSPERRQKMNNCSCNIDKFQEKTASCFDLELSNLLQSHSVWGQACLSNRTKPQYMPRFWTPLGSWHPEAKTSHDPNNFN